MITAIGAEMILPGHNTPQSVAAANACAGILRRVFRDADAALAEQVKNGVLRKAEVLAQFCVFRDAVRPFSATLADELVATRTEAV